MRPQTLLVVAAMASALGLSHPAAAGGDDSHPAYGRVYVHHHAYAPYRTKHIYHLHQPYTRHVHVVQYGADPYAWYYKQRGYYPYYNSGYWVPRADMRYRYRYTYDGPKYRYQPSWGYGPALRPSGRRHFWFY